MAEISASMVKELREKSGAGMMDCKKALNETAGNMDEALELLRKNGQAKMDKKANRIAAEGVCRLATSGDTKAAVVEVNSETDFVAKNDKFTTFVEAVAKKAVECDAADVEALKNEKYPLDESKTIGEALVELVSVIGEKLSLRRFEKVEAANGLVATYLHGGGRIGVIVEAETTAVNDTVKEAMTNLAMQVAALYPKYVTSAEVPADFKDHEREIIKAQIEQDPKMQGKPEKVITGAIEGRLNKELKEVCLMDQVYVKAEDGKQTVAAYLQQISKEVGAPVSVKRFVRFETGEGMEKKNEDFAAEVAAQMNA